MTVRTAEKQLVVEVPAVLASLLDVPHEDVKVEAGSNTDLLLSAAGHAFVVEVLGAASPGALAARASQVAAAARRQGRKAVPLLVVPFMSNVGRRVCETVGISWFDLSGNAHIVAPGIRIIVDGRPNRFRRVGRPASIFAPKSARVVRWLLENHGRALTQREIARATAMTDGFVSRIVSRLEHESYVLREPGGALRVKDPALLLDAWRDEYRFDRHVLLQGHVAARSGDALTRFVGDILAEGSVEHAATGLAAAWQMTHFAAFRIATFFLAESPSKDLREKLGFREDVRGANLWLVLPNDVGVFHGAETRDGLRCVHPVQAYVDLKAHAERATEAAERLRTELLSWRCDG
ncbi:MAG: MarR family transcriptional regulator [Burkholderiales bacterium]|nr:MarR family transcriptional regulator [Burkholderiales bacterium]MCZ2250015.1 MarR family transcriptional regulator [Bacteroidia bacterium]